jgi:PIN domain
VKMLAPCHNRPMPGQPLKRIYFDTNFLRRWPNPANNIAAVLRAANWMGTELYIPQTVEDELENQFLRDAATAYATAASGTKDLAKLFRNIIDTQYELPCFSDGLLREAFRERSTQLKDYFRISSIPLTEIPTKKLVEMAIRRLVPFQQHSLDKDHTVVSGLQDAAILFSVIEHLKEGGDGRNAFATTDSVFSRPETHALLDAHGATLEILKGYRELFDDLYDHIWESIKTAWHKEREQISSDLNQQKHTLAFQILAFLRPAQLAPGYKSIKEVKALAVDFFSYVMTTLPPVEHRPPAAATYTRPEGSNVEITAIAAVKTDAIVEQYSFLDVLLNTGIKSGQMAPEVRLEEMTLSSRLRVSITGTINNGRIADFRVTDVQVER